MIDVRNVRSGVDVYRNYYQIDSGARKSYLPKWEWFFSAASQAVDLQPVAGNDPNATGYFNDLDSPLEYPLNHERSVCTLERTARFRT